MSFPTINEPVKSERWFSPKDHDGHLLVLLTTHRFDDVLNYQKNGMVRAAYVDYVDLDSPNPEIKRGVEFKQSAIVNSLAIDRPNVTGRLKLVPTLSGNSAWVLQPPSETDREKVIAFLTEQQEAQVTPAATDDSPWGA